MTSRTTPVGLLVIALAGFIAAGCSAPTSAVFQALLDPTGTAVSSPEANPIVGDVVAGGDTALRWHHPDGYALTLPAGWVGGSVDRSETDELVDAITDAMPGLGARMEQVLGGSKTRVSAIAAGEANASGVAPVLVVLAQPTEGKRTHTIKTEVRERISYLPNLSSPLSAHDVVLPTAEGVRYDYTLDDPDLGELRVFSYLFPIGQKAYLVNFVAPADLAAEAESTFYSIADSLRFGV